MKIQDIINRFEDRDFKIYDTYNDDFKSINDYLLSDEIKQFLQDELTLMLDEIEKELPTRDDFYDDISDRYFCNKYRQEVINIINSHK